jgi:hypothetical protein
MRRVFTLTALAGLSTLVASAQVTPAPVLQIVRETTKEGREAAHEKVETEWASAARKANHPAHYVTLATVTGPSELWFVERMANFATFEEWGKASEKEPYKTINGNLNARDGELRSSSRTMWAVFRPDLSYEVEKFNPAKARFVTIDTFRVRLGKSEDFTAGGKTYYDAMKKANLHGTTVTYEVVAGAPNGTFLLITPMESLKLVDDNMAAMPALMRAMGPENFSRFMKSTGDIFVSMDSTIFQVKPGMSYAPQQFVDADPDFWKPKATAPEPKKGTQ